MKKKTAVVVLADTDGLQNFGRMANALELTRELREAGEEVKLVLTGAGVKWPVFMHEGKSSGDPFAAHYGDAFDAADKLACASCAVRYEVSERLAALEVESAGEPPRLLSLAGFLAKGYRILTF